MHPVDFRPPEGSAETLLDLLKNGKVAAALVAALSATVWALLRLLGGRFADEFKSLKEQVVGFRDDLKAYGKRLDRIEQRQDRLERASGIVGADWLDS